MIGLHIPALRERLDDIPQLVNHLLNKLAEDQDTYPKTLTSAAQAQLMIQSYPGNIRELENILARASALTESDFIDVDDLDSGLMFDGVTLKPEPSVDDSTPVNPPQVDLLREVDGDLEGYLANRERDILNEALTAHRWNRTSAAKALGISFRSLPT